MLVADQADEAHTTAALEFIYAQLDLLRIRAIRKDAMAELDDAAAHLGRLRRLDAVDRYEARALTRRRRASRLLTTS
jgi:hypothetical protein